MQSANLYVNNILAEWSVIAVTIAVAVVLILFILPNKAHTR